MRWIYRLLGFRADATLARSIILGILPFAALLAIYAYSSHARKAENPDDKLLPSFSQMTEAARSAIFDADKRTGERIAIQDTRVSLRRIGIGILAAATAGLIIGLHIGLFGNLRALLLPILTFLSIIPPLAILPIIFIVFGVGETAKFVLIFWTFSTIARDVNLAVRMIPQEQIVKAMTLGASPFEVAYRVVFPQIFPRLLETVRLTLGAAWLFLIASEAIASTEGLGFRIFLVRRYLAMDTIFPYVLWITLLGFAANWAIGKWISLRYPWYARSDH
ncbi:MAG: ABC transporter permease subunit [Candidatus Niyogibacteria bacterium]|nr:ABC transporter permease subunit [Candidatus Niyogibacteria bacterium]